MNGQINSSNQVSPEKGAHPEPGKAPCFNAENGAFEPLIDTQEAAALLKIHPKTLQKLARNGEVDAIQIGKLWRFRASALNRWLEEIAR